MSSRLDSDTVLAVDVGSVSTRASLFDVVDGRYRLIATGRAQSTAGKPLHDVSEGVRMALDQVQTVTGRQLLDESDMLIMPVTSKGAGADVFVATASAGPKIQTVLVGLMPGVSTVSAQRMANSTYLELIEVINLLDRRRDEEKISRIAAARADLILIVGGTDGGARELGHAADRYGRRGGGSYSGPPTPARRLRWQSTPGHCGSRAFWRSA